MQRIVDFFSEVTNVEQELLDNLTMAVIDVFLALARVNPDFTATWACLVTWFNVPGFNIDQSVCFMTLHPGNIVKKNTK